MTRIAITKLEYDKAAADISRILDRRPDDIPSLLQRGAIYAESRQSKRAIADFSRIIELDPNVPPVYMARALAYAMNDEFDKAWADVSKCKALGGSPPPAIVEYIRKRSVKAK